MESQVIFMRVREAKLDNSVPYVCHQRANGTYSVEPDMGEGYEASLFITVPIGSFLSTPLGDHYKVTIERTTPEEEQACNAEGSFSL